MAKENYDTPQVEVREEDLSRVETANASAAISYAGGVPPFLGMGGAYNPFNKMTKVEAAFVNINNYHKQERNTKLDWYRFMFYQRVNDACAGRWEWLIPQDKCLFDKRDIEDQVGVNGSIALVKNNNNMFYLSRYNINGTPNINGDFDSITLYDPSNTEPVKSSDGKFETTEFVIIKNDTYLLPNYVKVFPFVYELAVLFDHISNDARKMQAVIPALDPEKTNKESQTANRLNQVHGSDKSFVGVDREEDTVKDLDENKNQQRYTLLQPQPVAPYLIEIYNWVWEQLKIQLSFKTNLWHNKNKTVLSHEVDLEADFSDSPLLAQLSLRQKAVQQIKDVFGEEGFNVQFNTVNDNARGEDSNSSQPDVARSVSEQGTVK